MLDNPGECEIYPTGTAYTRLEHYIEQVRAEAIGWMPAEACTTLDRGDDPRMTNVPEMCQRVLVVLEEK